MKQQANGCIVAEFQTHAKEGSGSSFSQRFIYSQFVLFGTMSLLAVVATYSILRPLDFATYVADMCGIAVSVCGLAEAYGDREILVGLGYGNYAIGFEALRKAGLLIYPLMALTGLVAGVLLFNPAKKNFDNVAKNILTMGFLLVAVWFVYISPDFYHAADADFSGVLRPVYGSVLYVICAYCASGATAAFIYMFVREKLFREH